LRVRTQPAPTGGKTQKKKKMGRPQREAPATEMLFGSGKKSLLQGTFFFLYGSGLPPGALKKKKLGLTFPGHGNERGTKKKKGKKNAGVAGGTGEGQQPTFIRAVHFGLPEKKDAHHEGGGGKRSVRKGEGKIHWGKEVREMGSNQEGASGQGG